MSAITTDSVTLSQTWGATFGDYALDGTKVDFQDLMVAISERRAVAVEGEVEPLSTRIKNRNTTLEQLGEVLADLTSLQTQFDSDAEGKDRKGTLKQSSKTVLDTVFSGQVDFDNLKMTKYEVEKWLKMVKNKIDALNNVAQKDMTRLQQLVDRRDESFSTATTLMTAISDTRANLIRNL